MNQLDKNIAMNLKRIRKSKNMSLDMLAEQTGVSKSMLGQIERGESNPTISTIGKIMEGIRISFDDLINNPKERVEIIKKDDVLAYSHDGCNIYGYKTYDSGKNFEIYVIEIMPQKSYTGNPHGENSHEAVIVDEGTLRVSTADGEFIVQKGDLIDFVTDKSYVYYNDTSEILKLHVVFYVIEQKSNVNINYGML